MPIAPIRDLSKYGVIADIDAYNIPAQAWSFAVNARFRNGSVLRAPVFRTVTASLGNAHPRFVTSNSATTGFDSVIIGYRDGSVSSFKSGTETALSVTDYVPNVSDTAFTATRLGDVLYVNRSDRVPWAMGVADTKFAVLANWDSTWRANILRSCSSALLAFGVTKGGVQYPTMIKTSEFAKVNTVPTTWDNTITTNNATENILAEMDGAITDACRLGEFMVVYGKNEAWTMVMDGSTNVWSYHKLPFTNGAINANCSVELGNKNYVFGPTDIWVHDGVSDQSLCDKRTRELIFNSINLSKASSCFVVYHQALKEIHFNYVSGDRGVAFAGADGCNRAAILNVTDNTWTFDDRPFIFGAVRANLDNVLTYATVGATYATIGGTYLDQDDSLKKVLVMVGEANTSYSLSTSLYAFDQQGPGSTVSYPVDLNATKGVLLERDGIDLDEVGVDLRGYKVVNCIYPQARFEIGAAPLKFQFGSADHFNDEVVFSDWQTYDGAALYKLDYTSAGRFLSMRCVHDDYKYFNLSGFDIDIDVLGEQ